MNFRFPLRAVRARRTCGVLAGALLGVVLLACLSHPAPARPAAAAPAGQQVPLPYVLRDNFGGNWDVQQSGAIGDGGNDTYDNGGTLYVANAEYNSPPPTAAFDAARNEVVLSPAPLNGLNVTRRVAVNGKAGWCRWTEVLENPTAAPIHAQVHLNFDLGGAIQQTQPLVDEKRTKKQFGLCLFDGNHGLAMIGAGRGGKLVPRFQPQPGGDQVDVFYDVDVPAKQTVALVHLQVRRQSFNEVTQFAEQAKDKDYLAGLPADLMKVLANFPHAEKLVGDVEVLRGGLVDVVELRGGDLYRGTIKDPSFKLQTAYGPVELPANQVVGMMTVGTFKPAQLFVTADGEVIGGTLQSDGIKLQLSSGQVTAVPLHTITRLGFRKRPGEPEEWKFDKPTVFLRDGQRIGVQMPAETIPLNTVYGPLALKPELIAGLTFQGEDQPVHQVRLSDGSRFAALVGQDAFALKPRSAAGGGGGKPVTFPAAAIARLQFGQGPEEPDEDAPTLALTNGDVLVGGLAGVLELETAFDTIRLNGAEVRGLRHAAPAVGEGNPGAPTEVQVTMWDEATLSGRLKGDVVACALKCGTTVRVPVALIDQYTQPEPQPSSQMVEQIKAVVAELSAKDWRQRDRATDSLLKLGPGVAGVLKSLRPGQPAEGQKQIDAILKSLEEARKAAKAPPPPPTVPADPLAPQVEQDVRRAADVAEPEDAPEPAPAPPPN